jgi:hypothetical protein
VDAVGLSGIDFLFFVYDINIIETQGAKSDSVWQTTLASPGSPFIVWRKVEKNESLFNDQTSLKCIIYDIKENRPVFDMELERTSKKNDNVEEMMKMLFRKIKGY